MDIYLFVIGIIILAIDIYCEIHLKNYGSLFERLFHLIGLKQLFNIFKFSIFIFFAITLLNNSGIFISENIFTDFIISTNFRNWGFFIIFPFIISFLQLIFKSKKIINDFGLPYWKFHYRRNKQFQNTIIAIIQFLIFRIISFYFGLLIFKYTLLGYYQVLIQLTSKNLSIFDWLLVNSDVTDNYNSGVYLSLVLTVIIFIIFNNSFLKKSSDHFEYRLTKKDFIKYFFISIILSVGVFFGFFSIFNAVHNIINVGFFEWFSKENVLGILPIRISSLLILLYLLFYIYDEIIQKKILGFLILGIFPFRKIYRHYPFQILFRGRETVYFSQISFYILNIALAELFLIFNLKGVHLSILYFAILFIVDDFKIIDDYNRYFGKILKRHFFRVWIFNLIILGSATTILIINNLYYILACYIIISFFLLRYYLLNIYRLRFK